MLDSNIKETGGVFPKELISPPASPDKLNLMEEI